VGRFDSSWARELASLLDANDQTVRREVHFMVDRRNRIAHGHNECLTARRALALIDSAHVLADWFILRMNPTR